QDIAAGAIALFRREHCVATTKVLVAEPHLLALSSRLQQAPKPVGVFNGGYGLITLGKWNIQFRVVVNVADGAHIDGLSLSGRTVFKCKEAIFDACAGTPLVALCRTLSTNEGTFQQSQG